MFLSEAKRLKNIDSSIARNIPWMDAAPFHNGRWNICAGGPSLRKEISKIRKAKGVIVSVNGTHDYLLSKGIVPDYFILTDPREHNVRFVRKARKGIIYLVSADCDPKVFDALEGFDCRLWFDMGYSLPVPVQIGGGSTVGLRAINIGHTLGYQNIHLYGADGCVKEHHHAYPQPENDDEPTKEITFEGKSFIMTNWMVIQAADFSELLMRYPDLNITVHSPGALRHIKQHIGVHNASRRRTAPHIRPFLPPFDGNGRYKP